MGHEKQRTDYFRCKICAWQYYKIVLRLDEKRVIDICHDSDDIVTDEKCFGHDVAASYFRWHMEILVLSINVKLIVQTVGITSSMYRP